MKRPFDVVRGTILRNIISSKETSKFLFEHSDKLLVWIVGFSIGGITIIVTNLTELNKSFTHFDLKLILLFFSISIIFGIIYRISFYFYFIHYKNMEIFIEVSFSENEMMNIHFKDVSQVNNVLEMERMIKQDFGKKYYDIAELPETITDENKEDMLLSLRSLYTTLCTLSKKEFDDAIKSTKEFFQKSYGLSDKKIDKIFSNNNSYKWLKFYVWLTSISFLICCISFILVIIILCYTY